MTYKEVLGSVAAQKIKLPSPSNEVNWKSSMLFCQTLADAIESSGTKDLPTNFAGLIEPYINSILECAISERTQLSVQACRATGNLAKVLTKDMHPLLDRILPVLIRHCASTKAVNQKSSAAAISNIIVHSTYSPRLLWHICEAFEEKNVGPRLQAPGWLLLIMKEYQKNLTSERDLDTIVNSIHSGLIDADNNVRTKSRTLYWEYYKIDVNGAEEIKTRLNNHAITALDNDPANPNKKATKAKPKETARPESSLAQMRQQAKKRLQETAAAVPAPKVVDTHTFEPASITSANFAFGELELDDAPTEPRSKKASKDLSSTTASQKSHNLLPQQDNLHISKPTSRPISVHKKTASHEGQLPALNKKASAMEISNHTLHKKTSTAEGLRTSQTKKSTSSATTHDSTAPRSLLSGPVRRPRIVATPMHTTHSSSRPSSRADHPVATTAVASETATKPVKEAPPPQPPQRSHRTEVDQSTTSRGPQPLQQIKTTRKTPRHEISSPVLVPDGKENANIHVPPKTWTSDDGTPTESYIQQVLDHANAILPREQSSWTSFQSTPSMSHVQRVLDNATRTAESAQQYIDKQDAIAAQQIAATDAKMKEARQVLASGLGLMKSGHMDFMGFRKLKIIVCENSSDLITDQNQYNTLVEELLSRLGSVSELVHRGDPRDLKHPAFIRQAVLHMVGTLLLQYHPSWSEPFMGPALATLALARCAYSRNAKEFPGEIPIVGQPYMHENQTVELLMQTMSQVVLICRSPLDALASILDTLFTGEGHIMEHSDELKLSLSADNSWREAYASWDRYSKKERLNYHYINHLIVNNQPVYTPPDNLLNWEGFKHSDPDMPAKANFLMETCLKLITPLMMKARNYDHKLYPMQEEMLLHFTQHLLETYSHTLKRQIMPFCEQLYLSIDSETDFWNHFSSESDRNLLHYYLSELKR